MKATNYSLSFLVKNRFTELFEMVLYTCSRSRALLQNVLPFGISSPAPRYFQQVTDEITRSFWGSCLNRRHSLQQPNTESTCTEFAQIAWKDLRQWSTMLVG